MANPCGETWSNTIPPVLLIVSGDRFSADIQDDCLGQAAHVTFRDTGRRLGGECFHSRIKREIAHK